MKKKKPIANTSEFSSANEIIDTNFQLKKGFLYLLKILVPVLIVACMLFNSPAQVLAKEVGNTLKTRLKKVEKKTYLEILDNLQEIIMEKIPSEIRLGHPNTAIQNLFKSQNSVLDATLLILAKTEKEKEAVKIAAHDLLMRSPHSWTELIPSKGKKQIMVQLLKGPAMSKSDYKRIALHVAEYMKAEDLHFINKIVSLRAGAIGVKLSQILSSQPVLIPFLSLFVILTRKKNQQGRMLLEEITTNLGFKRTIENDSEENRTESENVIKKSIAMIKRNRLSFLVLLLFLLCIPALIVLAQKQRRGKILHFITTQKNNLMATIASVNTAVFEWAKSANTKKVEREEKVFLDNLTQDIKGLKKEVNDLEHAQALSQKKEEICQKKEAIYQKEKALYQTKLEVVTKEKEYFLKQEKNYADQLIRKIEKLETKNVVAQKQCENLLTYASAEFKLGQEQLLETCYDSKRCKEMVSQAMDNMNSRSKTDLHGMTDDDRVQLREITDGMVKNVNIYIDYATKHDKTSAKAVTEEKVTTVQKKITENIFSRKIQENNIDQECLDGNLDSCRTMIRQKIDAAHNPKNTIGVTEAEIGEFEVRKNKAIEDILDTL